MCGRLSSQQWGLAVRTLALRGNVRALHILPASQASSGGPVRGSSSSSSTAAAIPSLLPVRHHLLPHLHTLVVKGVTVTNLAEEAASFLAPPQPHSPPAAAATAATAPSAAPSAAAAAGFKGLRHLELCCAWSASGSLTTPDAFTAAMAYLPHTFPALTHFTLQLPAVAAPSPPYIAANIAAQAAAGGAAAAAAAAAAVRAQAAATAAVRHAQAQGSMLAAAVAAAAALPKLQHLTLAHAPNIWAGPGPVSSSHLAPAAAAAAVAVGVGGRVPAAAFRSLYDVGSWLLLQLPHLAHLQIDTVGAACCMSWSRGASTAHTTTTNPSSSTAASSSTIPTPAVKLTYHAGLQRPAAAPAAAAAGSTSSNGSSGSSEGTPQLLQELTALLSIYSRRPARELLPSITSLQAAIHPEQLPSTAAALAAMPSLTALKLTVLATSSRPTDFAALVAAAATPLAAAAAEGRHSQLESLTLLPGLGRVEVTTASLLPLAAAAGSSGSNGSCLRELKLVGNFAPCGSSGSSGVGAPASPWVGLRAMQGLQVLRVHQVGPDILEVPVDCLPEGLRVLDAKRVHLATLLAAAAAGDGSNDSNGLPAPSKGTYSNRAAGLQLLCLQDCRLDSVSSLASNNLQTVVIAATTLPGGWPAAVAAWPCLRSLTAVCPAVQPGSSSSSSSSGSGSRRGSKGAGQGLAAAAAGVGGLSAAAAEDAVQSGSSCSSRSSSKKGSRGAGQASAAAVVLGEPSASAAAAAAAEKASVRLMQELTGFRSLQALELQRLPCLNPSVLQLALCHMPHLSHFVVSGVTVSQGLPLAAVGALIGGGCSSRAGSGGCSCLTRGSSVCGANTAGIGDGGASICAAGGVSVKYLSIRLPAAARRTTAATVSSASEGVGTTPAAANSGVVAVSDSSSMGFVSAGSSSSCRSSCSTSSVAEVLHRLLQALPWCGVSVAADVCSGYVLYGC